jgi:hypothetical protein
LALGKEFNVEGHVAANAELNINMDVPLDIVLNVVAVKVEFNSGILLDTLNGIPDTVLDAAALSFLALFGQATRNNSDTKSTLIKTVRTNGLLNEIPGVTMLADPMVDYPHSKHRTSGFY